MQSARAVWWICLTPRSQSRNATGSKAEKTLVSPQSGPLRQALCLADRAEQLSELPDNGIREDKAGSRIMGKSWRPDAALQVVPRLLS